MRSIIVIFFLITSTISAQEIQNNIFGFATSNTFTYCDVRDTNFINNVIEINPKILRFPGGAVGNFYHFGKEGYGFDFIEIDKFHNGKFPKRSRGLENFRKKKKHNYDYIEDFIKLAKKTKSSAVLVANPFVDSDDDILLMIDKIQKNNISVIGVELGSELSNRSYFTRGYDVEDYILFAERCSKKIKSKFPKIKIAIVVAPLGKKHGHRHNIWNTKMSKKTFYDAVIIHSYAKVINGKTLDGAMLTEHTIEKDKSKQFNEYKDKIINYFNTGYPSEIKSYNTIFNKPIWVTEWNLQMSKTTGNTMLQSLFVAQYFLEALSNQKLSSIELTTYHNLGGRDLSGSIFGYNNNLIDIRSTFYPISMIGKIFENDIVSIKQTKTDNIFFYKCFDINNKEIISYKVDWMSNHFSCIYSIDSTKYCMTYSSLNLFDKADKKGLLNLNIYEIEE